MCGVMSFVNAGCFCDMFPFFFQPGNPTSSSCSNKYFVILVCIYMDTKIDHFTLLT